MNFQMNVPGNFVGIPAAKLSLLNPFRDIPSLNKTIRNFLML